MAQELVVVLHRRDPDGFGFSLLGKPGFPPVIYDIAENSPAAESGQVQAGDVILQVNETDVIRCNTKEVLKCLRLSKDPVSLRLKRDPSMKEEIRDFLSSSVNQEPLTSNRNNNSNDSNNAGLNNNNTHRSTGSDYQIYSSKNAKEIFSNGGSSSPHIYPLPDTNSNRKYCETELSPAKPSHPKFEAFMMTGDRVLKLTKNQQMSILPKHQKKIDSLLQRYHNTRVSNRYKNKSTPLLYQNSNSVPSSPVDPPGSPSDELKSSSTGTSPILSINTNTIDTTDTGCIESSSSTVVRVNVSTVSTGTMTMDTLEYSSSRYLAQMSRSDDHLRKDASVSTVCVFDEEDVTSSLNTLLDTKNDSSGKVSLTVGDDEKVPLWTSGAGEKIDDQRVLWTYNAPHAVIDNSISTSDENVTSSRQSPTSISSSVLMSSQSSDRKRMMTQSSATSFDVSQVETLSSPENYNEECCDIMNSPDVEMDFSDPTDSDSTLLVSEPKIRRISKFLGGSVATSSAGVAVGGGGSNGREQNQNHRIVIQVRGVEKEQPTLLPLHQQNIDSIGCNNNNRISSSSSNSNINVVTSRFRRYNSLVDEDDDYIVDPKKMGYQALNEYDDELLALTEGAVNLAKAVSPSHSASSEDETSDVESLHSFHYSPKAVDYPSAIRLAKRLYLLDGFKKSDVSRHLSKNNDFSRAVAEEYSKHFNFENQTLDIALRQFLKQFSLSGETQERERVLVHFSKRYLDCNPDSFNSQDAVHTLTCALMLLNTDLHGQFFGRKMTCNAFIENLNGLNDGDNFSKDVLKQLYHGIKYAPLEWATDEDTGEIDENGQGSVSGNDARNINDGSIKKDFTSNHESFSKSVIDYKKGYVMRKCCLEPNGKKTPLGKRGWKMFYCTLRTLVLYLHKDEHGFRKSQISDNAHNAIRLHHALATKASDYTKKLHVFRLETADRAEYLFQTSDSKELQSWVDTINLVCASFSSPALAEPVGSQKKFQRPLLPSAPSNLILRYQLKEHEMKVEHLENDLELHKKNAPERNSKTLVVNNFKEKETYLCYELKRYKTYVYLLESRLQVADQPKSASLIPLADIDSEEECSNPDDENNSSTANAANSNEDSSYSSVTNRRKNSKTDMKKLKFPST